VYSQYILSLEGKILRSSGIYCWM